MSTTIKRIYQGFPNLYEKRKKKKKKDKPLCLNWVSLICQIVFSNSYSIKTNSLCLCKKTGLTVLFPSFVSFSPYHFFTSRWLLRRLNGQDQSFKVPHVFSAIRLNLICRNELGNCQFQITVLRIASSISQLFLMEAAHLSQWNNQECCQSSQALHIL